MADVAGPSRKRVLSDASVQDHSDTYNNAEVTDDQEVVQGKKVKRRPRKKRRTTTLTNLPRTVNPTVNAEEPIPIPPKPTFPLLQPIAPPDAVGMSSNEAEETIKKLTSDLEAQSAKLRMYDETVRRVQETLTCQICLDVLRRPYALSPCGHVACHGCLLQWFQVPLEEEDVPKPKTCPHCRANIIRRPVEIFAIKDAVSGLLSSGLLKDIPEANEVPLDGDIWKGIFGTREGNALNDRLESTGLLDEADGVYRCLDCHTEILDHECQDCGRFYPLTPGDGHGEDVLGLAGRMMFPFFGGPRRGLDFDLIDDGELTESSRDEDDEDGHPMDMGPLAHGYGPAQDGFIDIDGSDGEDNEFRGFIDDEEDRQEGDGGRRAPIEISDDEDGNSDVVVMPARRRLRAAFIMDDDEDEEATAGDDGKSESGDENDAALMARGMFGFGGMPTWDDAAHDPNSDREEDEMSDHGEGRRQREYDEGRDYLHGQWAHDEDGAEEGYGSHDEGIYVMGEEDEGRGYADDDDEDYHAW
ncbi:hypothetical protein CYLTODRAFT_443997, partial [Cylindrobasidium torrendii FP15055 ss-10]